MVFQAGDTVPYGPPSTVIEFITRYRERGMPTPITPEVLERAGISEALTRRTIQSLKLLSILDSESNPTLEFEAATRAMDDEFKARLGELILGQYSEVLTFADPATDSYDRVKGAFRGFNPRAQQDRQITMFLGLLDFLGLDTSAASISRKPAAPKSTAGRTPGSSRGSKAPKPDDTPTVPVDDGDLPPGLIGLLKQIPRNGDGWSKARRDEFVSVFSAVLDFSVPTREAEPVSTGDPEEAP